MVDNKLILIHTVSIRICLASLPHTGRYLFLPPSFFGVPLFTSLFFSQGSLFCAGTPIPLSLSGLVLSSPSHFFLCVFSLFFLPEHHSGVRARGMGLLCTGLLARNSSSTSPFLRGSGTSIVRHPCHQVFVLLGMALSLCRSPTAPNPDPPPGPLAGRAWPFGPRVRRRFTFSRT